MSYLITTHSTCLLLLVLAQAPVYADDPKADQDAAASSPAAASDESTGAETASAKVESGEVDHANETDDETQESEDTDVKSTGAAPLSVPPLDQVEYSEDRPEWVSQPAELQALPYRWAVVSGPSETREESLEELRIMQRASVETYLKSLPGSEGRFDFFPLTDQWIESELVIRAYEGEVTQEGLTLYEHAVELQIDRETEAAMRAALKNFEVRHRLGAVGVLVATGLLGLIFSSALVGTVSRRVQRRESVKAASI